MAIDSLQLFNKKLAEKLIEAGTDESEILECCFSKEAIHLDFYGSFSHLKGDEWEDSISSLKLFPNDLDGETFVLLLPRHVNEILESLKKHIEDLTVMSEKEIDEISQFNNFCAQNDGFMVAYLFDF